jgi:hypothetical protein
MTSAMRLAGDQVHDLVAARFVLERPFDRLDLSAEATHTSE